MKRTIFTIVCLLALSTVFAQGTTRFMVATEDATGTWCTYCPGAAMGCDDLLSNGKGSVNCILILGYGLE